jgi:plastocyanin
MSRVPRVCLAAALAALALGLVAAAGAPGSLAKATGPKIVKVCGYYFTPVDVKVHKGGKVRWKWASCGTSDNHDVVLKKAPSGVDKSKYRSQIALAPSSYTFTKAFKKRGKYDFICSLHPTQMKMTVTVRR